MSQGRASNGFGANPLSWVEIKAWADLTGKSPNEWEIEVIKAIDMEYLND